MNQRTIDLALSVIAAVIGWALSWPFWRDTDHWPVSHAAWIIYFVIGFLMSVYIFYVFMVALHTLFAHEAITKDAAANAGRDQGGRP